MLLRRVAPVAAGNRGRDNRWTRGGSASSKASRRGPDPRPAVRPNAVKEAASPFDIRGPRATRRGGHDAADEAHAEPTEVVMVHPISFGPSRQLPGAPASVFCTATLRSVGFLEGFYTCSTPTCLFMTHLLGICRFLFRFYIYRSFFDNMRSLISHRRKLHA